MGVCGKHWKWIQLRSCKIWCKIYKENTYVNIIILRGQLYHLFEVLNSNLVGDEGPEATDVSIPKVFYPAYEFRSYQCELPEPQRKPQLLLYKGGVVRVSVVTVAMRMWGGKINKVKPKPSPEGAMTTKVAHLKFIHADEIDPTKEMTPR